MTASSGSSSGRSNRVVARLRATGDAEELHRVADELAREVPGAQVVRVSPSGRMVLALPDGADPAAVATQLDRRPEVMYAEQDVVDRG